MMKATGIVLPAPSVEPVDPGVPARMHLMKLDRTLNVGPDQAAEYDSELICLINHVSDRQTTAATWPETVQ